jgi:peptidoglycan/xylan/chitin deacetylase (PgdA/CDA1 family)
MTGTSRSGGGLPLVLLYHQIGTPDDDPFQQFVAPERFAGHMEVVARRTPVSLGELAADLRSGRPRPGSVAVTFDDGYLNNLRLGAPVLERYDVPATVFVTSAMTGGERDFWWCELADAVRQAPAPAGELRLQGEHGPHAWTTDGVDRRRLLFEVWAWLRAQPPASLRPALAAVRRWAELGEPAPPTDERRCMTIAELHELQRGGIVEIGAHTRTHPMLAALPADAQLDEIAGSRSDLADWLGQPPRAFAYPFGHRVREYRAPAVRAVRESGFELAAAVAAQPVSARSSVFEIPRYAVPDIPADAFERWLSARTDGSMPRRRTLLDAPLTRALRERRPTRDRL